MHIERAVVSLLLSAAICLSGCQALRNTAANIKANLSGKNYYTAAKDKARAQTLSELFTILKRADTDDSRFAALQEIANNYMRAKEYSRLANFLSSWIAAHPEDPYTAYYLLMIGYSYIQQGADPVAALYLDRLVRNYNDITVRNQSVQYLALKSLVNLNLNASDKAWYYEELLNLFPDKIDVGNTWFLLGKCDEATGNWDAAIKAYIQFLPYPAADVPGYPDAYTYAKQMVDYSRSSKDWTFATLDDLVNAVKSAIDSGSSRKLSSYMSKVNFFARTWEQEDVDTSSLVDFNLSDFMVGNRIHYSKDLAPGSNASEAWLRTTGWSQYISVWYLYFRKIYFPPDPAIHGRWEWAGIYYGEKF
jgi:tetratricopeptide (TPR) repeat protein